MRRRRQASPPRVLLLREHWEEAHTFRTPRLVLRPVRSSDADAIAATIDAEVIEAQGFTDETPAYYRETARRLGAEEALSGCAVWFAVCDLTGAVIGDYQLNRAGPGAPWTLGWWLGPTARGRGLGSESLAAMLEHVHRHVGIADVRIGTAVSNERALRQIRGAGATETDRGPHRLPNGSSILGVWFLHRDPALDPAVRPAGWRPPCHAWAGRGPSLDAVPVAPRP